MILVALLGQPSCGSEVQALIASFLTESKAVGVSVSVRDDRGERSWFGGYADREAMRVVDGSTVFRLGSISKPLTATCVMQLVEKGRLDLDKPISTYVEGFDDHAGKITLRRVLNHTSGIRHYLAGKDDAFYTPKSTADAIKVFSDDPLLFEPGEKYSYSTHAYTLAAAAVERASGVKFGDYLRTHVSGPAESQLELEVQAIRKPTRANVYRFDKAKGASVGYPRREDISWKSGGGGMEATSQDLARVGWAFLNGKLVSDATRTAMWTSGKLNDGKATGYGLGWGIGANGIYSHTGSQQGCSSVMSLDVKRHRVIVVMSNTTGVDAAKLGTQIRGVLSR